MAKILIVDDDAEITNLYERFLTLEGYETTSLNESAKALDVANAIIPDLFILDLMMPQPYGFKLCRLLRDDPQFELTPILITTALGDNDSKVIAYGAGANDYLIKPFHINELAERVRKLI